MKRLWAFSLSAAVVLLAFACGEARSAGAGDRKTAVAVTHRAEVYRAWPFDAPEAARRQEATAKALGVPKEVVLGLGGNVAMKLALIPAGRFMMGSPAGEPGRRAGEELPHEVVISEPFYMGVYEVTVGQYRALMGNEPGDSRSPLLPVCGRWGDAVNFCGQVSNQKGIVVELPTEAQWEYACRAGTETTFQTGATLGRDQAAFGGPSRNVCLVGQFKPNPFGLYDMHGNVSEWCRNCYRNPNPRPIDPFEVASMASLANILHPKRGGGLGDSADFCRSASRAQAASGDSWDVGGFRVVVPWRTRFAEAAKAVTVAEKARRILASVRRMVVYDRRLFRKCVVELAALGPEAKSVILPAIADADLRVHECALGALSYMPSAGDVNVLVDWVGRNRLVSWEGFDWRGADVSFSWQHAELSLKLIGRPAVGPLIGALHRKGRPNWAAMEILYDIDPEAAADPVLEIGKRDEREPLRYHALELALSHGDRRALEPLFTAIESDKHKDIRDQDGLAIAFRHGGKRGVDILIPAIEADDRALWHVDGETRDVRLVPYLIKGLDSKSEACLPNWCSVNLSAYDDDPRVIAALAAHGYGEKRLDAESFESLVSKLRGPDASVARLAAEALGRRRDTRAVGPLAEVALTHSRAAYAAVRALVKIGGKTVRAPVLKALLDEESDWVIEPWAIEALGKMHAQEAVEPLIRIAVRRGENRVDAIRALGQIGGSRAAAALEKIVKQDEDVGIRLQAWSALRRCTSKGQR